MLSELQTSKIALDTNMLLASEQFKIDLMEEIEKNIPKAKIVVPTQVLDELKKIAKRSKRIEKSVRIAQEIMKAKKIRQVKVKAKNADNALLTLAGQGFIIGTNDKELRKRVKKNFGKCLILRKRKYLILE